MAAHIPPAAGGYVAGVLLYSVVCLGLSLLLARLVWIHHERTSFVAFFAVFTSLSTTASIVQQIHTMVFWRRVKTDQYHARIALGENPELYIAGASTGLDLVLFYIQFYCYNVEALLVVLWAAELAWAVFRLRAFRSKRLGRHALLVAKGVAVLFPVLQVSLLRTRAVQQDQAGFLFLADVIMVFSFLASSILLLIIATKYISSRQSMTTWDVQYGQWSLGTQLTETNSSVSTKGSPRRRRNIYDTWLVIRFSIAFLMLGVFELLSVLFEMKAQQQTVHTASAATGPDLSAAQARSDFVLFMPGVTASLVVFIVFGTTRTFRDDMWRWFVPRRLRDAYEARQWAKRVPSVVLVAPEHAPPPPPPPMAWLRRPSNAKAKSYGAGKDVCSRGLYGKPTASVRTAGRDFLADVDGSSWSLPSDGLEDMIMQAMERQGLRE